MWYRNMEKNIQNLFYINVYLDIILSIFPPKKNLLRYRIYILAVIYRLKRKSCTIYDRTYQPYLDSQLFFVWLRQRDVT